MKITFRDRKLEKLANDDRKRLAAMGKKRSDRFNLRMVDLMQAENLEDVRHLPGNFHELTGPPERAMGLRFRSALSVDIHSA